MAHATKWFCPSNKGQNLTLDERGGEYPSQLGFYQFKRFKDSKMYFALLCITFLHQCLKPVWDCIPQGEDMPNIVCFKHD